jgi:hypothetical protein
MTINPHREKSKARLLLVRAAIAVLFTLGGYFAWQGFSPGRSHSGVAPAVTLTRFSEQSSPPNFVPIEQINVGQRVVAGNPTGEFDDSLGREVESATWRKLTLKAPKFDGTTADVVLLRPQWWLQEEQARVGGTVLISVPECGIDGRADVLAIEPCPQINSGEGRVVIGTYRHQPAAILKLHFEGLDSALGVTGNHPIWSEDRQEFVHAEELRPGEHLRTSSGTLAIRSISAPQQAEPVFNLEVLGEHVYHVGENGILVHNGNSKVFKGLDTSLEGLGYVYELLDDQGKAVYFGQAEDYADLVARRREHIVEKAGKWSKMRVIAQGLDADEMDQLEHWLMTKTASGNPYQKRNILPGLLNKTVSTSVPRDDAILEKVLNNNLLTKDVWACPGK